MDLGTSRLLVVFGRSAAGGPSADAERLFAPFPAATRAAPSDHGEQTAATRATSGVTSLANVNSGCGST
jgi:hypothetical protein